VAFGVVLDVSGIGSAGAGHGSYLPLFMFAAPLSLLPLCALFAAPVWWGITGWLLKGERRRLAIAWLAVHTATVGLILWFGNPFEPGDEQWRYFNRVERIMPLWLWSGFVIYAIGLLVTWALTIKPIESSESVGSIEPVESPTRRAAPTSD
jgi:hypothetical protein